MAGIRIGHPVSRGEIWRVNLDPHIGPEAAKTRPALIVGRRALAEHAMTNEGTVTVVPLTTNTKNVFDFQVLIPSGDSGLSGDSKAQAEQVRTISTERLVGREGGVSAEISAAVDEAIRVYLGL